MNSLGFKLAALAIGLVLGLGAIEFALRMLGAGERPGDLRGLHEAPAGVPWIYGLRPHAKLEVRGSGSREVDVLPDGRFVYVGKPVETMPTHLEVVLNWFEELESRVPASVAVR